MPIMVTLYVLHDQTVSYFSYPQLAGIGHDLRMVDTGVAKHCQYCKHIRESNPTTNPSHEPNAVYVSH